MIGLGFKCDRIVVESVENGVKVSCVMICKIEWEFINSGGVVFGSKGLMDRGVFDYKV